MFSVPHLVDLCWLGILPGTHRGCMLPPRRALRAMDRALRARVDVEEKTYSLNGSEAVSVSRAAWEGGDSYFMDDAVAGLATGFDAGPIPGPSRPNWRSAVSIAV